MSKHMEQAEYLLEVSQDGQLRGIMVDHHQRWATHALGLVSQQVAALRIGVIRNDYSCITHSRHTLPTSTNRSSSRTDMCHMI